MAFTEIRCFYLSSEQIIVALLLYYNKRRSTSTFGIKLVSIQQFMVDTEIHASDGNSFFLNSARQKKIHKPEKDYSPSWSPERKPQTIDAKSHHPISHFAGQREKSYLLRPKADLPFLYSTERSQTVDTEIHDSGENSLFLNSARQKKIHEPEKDYSPPWSSERKTQTIDAKSYHPISHFAERYETSYRSKADVPFLNSTERSQTVDTEIHASDGNSFFLNSARQKKIHKPEKDYSPSWSPERKPQTIDAKSHHPISHFAGQREKSYRPKADLPFLYSTERSQTVDTEIHDSGENSLFLNSARQKKIHEPEKDYSPPWSSERKTQTIDAKSYHPISHFAERYETSYRSKADVPFLNSAERPQIVDTEIHDSDGNSLFLNSARQKKIHKPEKDYSPPWSSERKTQTIDAKSHHPISHFAGRYGTSYRSKADIPFSYSTERSQTADTEIHASDGNSLFLNSPRQKKIHKPEKDYSPSRSSERKPQTIDAKSHHPISHFAGQREKSYRPKADLPFLYSTERSQTVDTEIHDSGEYSLFLNSARQKKIHKPEKDYSPSWSSERQTQTIDAKSHHQISHFAERYEKSYRSKADLAFTYSTGRQSLTSNTNSHHPNEDMLFPYSVERRAIRIKQKSHKLKEDACFESGRQTLEQDEMNVQRVVVQRFSEAESVPIDIDKDLTVAGLLRQITCVGSSDKVELYHKYMRLEPKDNVEVATNVSGETIHIYVCVTTGNRSLPHHQRERKERDMFDPQDNDDRYLMPCGHAITPENLYAFCWSELNSGKVEFKCPAIIDDYTKTCNKKWDFRHVVRGACLSDDEMNLFSGFLSNNWLKLAKSIQLCPKCGEAIERSSCMGNLMECVYCSQSRVNSEFCFICTRPWRNRRRGDRCGNDGCSSGVNPMRSILQNCGRKTIVGVQGCPCVRACPECRAVVEYTSDNEEICKHMECPICHAMFCFICLEIKAVGDMYWPCGGAYEICNLASIQELE
ncbi:hypothetical protein ScPMuIL_013136 [Solemya velum]